MEQGPSSRTHDSSFSPRYSGGEAWSKDNDADVILKAALARLRRLRDKTDAREQAKKRQVGRDGPGVCVCCGAGMSKQTPTGRRVHRLLTGIVPATQSSSSCPDLSRLGLLRRRHYLSNTVAPGVYSATGLDERSDSATPRQSSADMPRGTLRDTFAANRLRSDAPRSPCESSSDEDVPIGAAGDERGSDSDSRPIRGRGSAIEGNSDGESESDSDSDLPLSALSKRSRLEEMTTLQRSTRVQMLYVVRGEGEGCLWVVRNWFSGANAKLFSLMLQHLPMPFDAIRARAIDLQCDGYQKLPGMHIHLALYSRVFIRAVDAIMRRRPNNQDPLSVRRWPLLEEEELRGAYKAWRNDAELARQLRTLLLSTDEYSPMWWHEVPLHTDSLVMWAGPHRVSSRDGRRFDTKRAVVYINAVDQDGADTLVARHGDGAWRAAIAASALPEGYGGASVTPPALVEWGWGATEVPTRSHLISARLAGSSVPSQTPICSTRDRLARGETFVAGLLNNSYHVETNALGSAPPAGRLPPRPVEIERQLLSLLRAEVARVTRSKNGLYRRTLSATWSDDSLIDFDDPWTVVRLLSPQERASRVHLDRASLNDDALERVLDHGSLGAHYAPLVYDALAHLAEPIACLWFGLYGLRQTHVYYAPGGSSLRHLDTEAQGQPPHIDRPCVPK